MTTFPADFTLIALRALRNAQLAVEAAETTVILSRHDRTKAGREARKAAEQELFDRKKILTATEEQADVAIAHAASQQAA